MSLIATKRVISPLFLLFIPLFGALFSNQVNWSLFDFIIMGTLLGLFGLSVHLIIEKVKNKTLRIVPVLFVIIIFLIIWAELAVGIFGTPFAGS